MKAFIRFPATGVAILVLSRSARWYVTLSIVLVTTYGPNHCFANYAWTGADCRDQHPVALIDIPWSESHWCLVDRALLVVRSFVVLVVACSTSSGLCLCCRMRDANNSSRLISSRICSSRTFLRSIVFLISEINRKLGPFPFSLS